MGPQRLQNNVALEILDGSSCEILQRYGPRPRHTRAALLQMVLLNRRLRADQDETRDAVRKLTHIPGPVEILQIIEHAGGERHRRLAKLPFMMLAEKFGEQRNISAPFAQAGHAKAHDIDTIKKVGAKIA